MDDTSDIQSCSNQIVDTTVTNTKCAIYMMIIQFTVQHALTITGWI